MNCIVKPYTGNCWAQVGPLLETWPFKPLARHDGWRAPSLLDFTSARVAKTLENQNGAAWVALLGNRACGFTSLNLLPWDSEQLSVTAARIDYLVAEGSYHEQECIKRSLLDAVLAEAGDRGVIHLSVRVDASDLSSLHVLERAGFVTVDGILTFALDLKARPHQTSAHDFNIRLATASDADQTAALARTAYLYDRFHSDPTISRERADELHATWLRNSCVGNAADAVVLAEDRTGLLGFVTCTLQRDTQAHLGRMVGTIVLVASALRARGRGVGYATTLWALEWFSQQGCEIVEVGTQLRNIAASRLYQKCGFRLVGSSISLRRVLQPIPPGNAGSDPS
jgi:dTDP-4-amino-4,6-dideoxy-D-galactose acyltransferase